MTAAERVIDRKVAGAETRARAGRLYARILRASVPISAVAAETPHDDGGTYADPPARQVYVRQVLTGDRTSAPMVARLEAAFSRLVAPSPAPVPEGQAERAR